MSLYGGHAVSTCPTSSIPVPHLQSAVSDRPLLCKNALREPCPVSMKPKLKPKLKDGCSCTNVTSRMKPYVTRPLSLLVHLVRHLEIRHSQSSALISLGPPTTSGAESQSRSKSGSPFLFLKAIPRRITSNSSGATPSKT
ncbi:hypothetical protein FF38_14056 [Lucilia cuprina]|uniref:Uncharacterized protein n=1 Tax=Lucilia cuprina TaxID=7375 RepID=A0A0L0BYS2_LUCCU|nr:hypothetical protein FF38_14056 [Lucilia cuprina]